MKKIEIIIPDSLYRETNTSRIEGVPTIAKKIEHLLTRGYFFTCGEGAELIKRMKQAKLILNGNVPETQHEEIDDDTEPTIFSSQDYDIENNFRWK